MALTKVNRGGLNTGISDSSDATFLTVDSSEQAVIKSEGGAVTTSVQQGLAKCFGRFSATQFNDSFNMSSFTDNSQGNHTLNFNNDMANTNYTNAYASEGGSDVYRYIWESATATGSTTIKTYYFTNSVALTQADFADNGYTNHGDLA
jgi:hypothetical protein